MDADNTPLVRTMTSVQGGTVEPANRATIAKERFQTPIDVPAERYELRDPFAEVTYRANTFPEMVAKADQLGSSRFVALDAQGKRTTVQKVDGEWQRGPQHAAAPARPVDITPARNDVPQAANVVPLGQAQPQTRRSSPTSMRRRNAPHLSHDSKPRCWIATSSNGHR